MCPGVPRSSLERTYTRRINAPPGTDPPRRSPNGWGRDWDWDCSVIEIHHNNDEPLPNLLTETCLPSVLALEVVMSNIKSTVVFIIVLVATVARGSRALAMGFTDDAQLPQKGVVGKVFRFELAGRN